MGGYTVETTVAECKIKRYLIKIFTILSFDIYNALFMNF